ncbi:hypothetical protein HKX48_007227 [Thoreauomyces humboldtii]|nr:hypothetical protein HKX48_007227 [Thoreauomyces humboldtii]
MYSVYALPNIILPLIGGLLIDNLSATTMLVVFCGFVGTGQALYATGVEMKSFPLMLVGRAVFGSGAESLEVGVSRILTTWFHGRGLGLATSLHSSMAKLAATCTDNLSPIFANRFSTRFAVWISLTVCCYSFISAVVVIFLDRPASRALAGVVSDDRAPAKKTDEDTVTSSKPSMKAARRQPETLTTINESTTTLDLAASNAMLTDEIKSMASLATLYQTDAGTSSDEGSEDEGYDEDDESVHFSQLRGLNTSFWVICLVTIAIYLFQAKWYPGDSEMAGTVMSIPDIVGMVGSPLCGLFIDRYGRRTILLPLACVLTLIAHVLLGWTMVTPIFSMTLIGISFSIMGSAIWTCVPFIVGSHQIATAYGILSMVMNGSLAVSPLIVAKISSASTSFVPVETYFVGLSILATFVSLVLLVVDERDGGVLRASHRPVPDVAQVDVMMDVKSSEMSLVPTAEEGDLVSDLPASNDVDVNVNDDETGSGLGHFSSSSRRGNRSSHLRITTARPEHHAARRGPSSSIASSGSTDHGMIRVVGNGLVVMTPHTQVHHHHKRHGPDEPCTCAADADRLSAAPRSAVMYSPLRRSPVRKASGAVHARAWSEDEEAGGGDDEATGSGGSANPRGEDLFRRARHR